MTSFTVSPDGTKIAWNTGENILCYNRETKKFTKYNQITKKDITAENIIFAGNDKLAFYGTKGESEEDTCYGYFDLKNKKIHTFIEKKYEAFFKMQIRDIFGSMMEKIQTRKQQVEKYQS